MGKTYWKGIEERENTPEFQQTLENEFPESLPVEAVLQDTTMLRQGMSRRSFLKAAGFSIAGAVASSCARGPVEKAIPLLNRPEEYYPGTSLWYASTCAGCSANCGILVKTRDGRPIKIEGNPEHPISRGGVCAVGQAAVLSLYDSYRLKQPYLDGKLTDWATVDRLIREKLGQISGQVYVLTGTLTSPSTRAAIQAFLSRFADSAHIEYDAVSYSAILDAHEETHGRRVLPRYRFDRAEMILSLEADFLGTWVSPVEFSRAYVAGRDLNASPPRMSYHVQVEGRMSLTGTNADERIKASPADIQTFLNWLAGRLLQDADLPLSNWPESELTGIPEAAARHILQKLKETRGKSLVVCGINDVATQKVVNLINQALGNYGRTLDLEQPSQQWAGRDADIAGLIEKMHNGQVKALFVADTNPVYSLPNGDAFAAALAKVQLTVMLSQYMDETAEKMQVVCPLSHFLESWNDHEPVAGTVSVTQPAIRPLGDTRSMRECFAAWSGKEGKDPDLMRAYWEQAIYPRRQAKATFQEFWNQAVHDGFALANAEKIPAGRFRWQRVSPIPVEQPGDRLFLVLYEKVGMRDGRHAFNPWLQELPDPVTKAVWDNYVCMAPALARKLNLREADLVRITDGKTELELPVQLQPGQHEQVVAIALGYGRKGTDRFSKIGPQWLQSRLTVKPGDTVGKNAYPLARLQDGTLLFSNRVQLAPTGRRGWLAFTQTHHTITVPKKFGGKARDMVREATFAAFLNDPGAGNPPVGQILQLWPQDFKYTGHHWAMVIDLSKCTGCSACVVSCQAENNVAVVGKDEVYRRREMHWIRIDRYYSGDDGEVTVIHQPVMCQHCDHAPCEPVCPVLATVHSDEGINQQIYNRCVGTRYCANNCPYKVRRFNWFDYRKQRKPEDLVLNPDVTTRTRGVMEKCSLCVQRIQEAKAEAKREGRELKDGDIRLACEQSCPTGAIVFGDMNDPNSRVTRLIQNPRHYRMLEEFNFRPTVGYLTKIRNTAKNV